MNEHDKEEIIRNIDHNVEQHTEEIVKELNKTHVFKTTRDDNKRELWVYVDGIYVPEGISYIREFMRKLLKSHYKDFYVKCVVDKIMADTYIDIDDFFSINYIDEIPVENGILNLIDNKLYPFTPDKIFFNKINAKFDKSNKCNSIKKFLETTLDKKDVKKIIQFIGYCLYKSYPINKSFMFSGDGSNGKTRVLELIRMFLGERNCVNLSLEQMERENNNFEIISLHGKLVNISGDINSTSLKKTGMFKRLIGSDLVKAPRKYKTAIEFVNYAKMVFCANQLPYSYDTSLGFFRRWELIEFPYTFYPKKEFDLLEKESEYNKLANPDIIKNILNPKELSGLLNWCLSELTELLKNKEFDGSGLSSVVKTRWIRKSDSFHAFFQDYLIEDYDGIVKKTDLRRQYSIYCRKHRIMVKSDKMIHMILNEKGISESRKTFNNSNDRDYVWLGVKFNTENAYIDDDGCSMLKREEYTVNKLLNDIDSLIEKKPIAMDYLLSKFDKKHHIAIESKIIPKMLKDGIIFSAKPGFIRRL